MKYLLTIFLVPVLFVGCTTVSPTKVQMEWENICPNPDVPYCQNVGKDAYNNSKSLSTFLRGIKLGKITGVTWRPKGSIIGYAEAIPKAGIPERIRTSPRDAYYYIINDGMLDADGKKLKPFIRQCREIDAK